MRLATRINYAGDFAAAVDRVVALEGGGARRGVGARGVRIRRRDTARVSGGEDVASAPGVRDPADLLANAGAIAMTAAGLDDLSGGRAILGLGASGPQVVEGWHGVAFDRPLRRTREIIDICRAIWRPRLRHVRGPVLRAAAAARAGHRTGQAVEDR